MDYIKSLPLPPPRCRSAPHQLPLATAVCTLLHSGLHIQYMKSSRRQQYLKRNGNRKVRKYRCLPKKGNQYRKVFDYWWELY